MMARASGRRFFIAEMTSRLLPLPSLMSTTAKTGAAFSTWRRPSPTDSAVVTVKPRPSMARARRCRNDLSSSTIRSERSLGIALDPASFIAVSNPEPDRPPEVPSRPHDLQLTRRLELRSHSGSLKWGRRDRRFKIFPVPGHGDGGAVQRWRLIDQRELGPGALQKGLGYKKTELKPKQRGFVGLRTARAGPAMGDIGGAQAVDHFGSKARAIVADGDADLFRRPAGRDLDSAAREIHCIFNQVAEAIPNRGIALTGWLTGAVGRIADVDGNAEIAVRRHRFLDQGRKRHTVERLTRRQFGDLGQNLTAALGLLAQQLDVLGVGRAGLERALDLADHDRDRC